jgi:hypothetical protein
MKQTSEKGEKMGQTAKIVAPAPEVPGMTGLPKMFPASGLTA